MEVPEGAQALRLDILDTHGGLDLHLRRGAPILRRGQVTHAATNKYGRETLVVTKQSPARLRPGTWYVDVVDYGAREGEVPFALLATLQSEPPGSLLAIPPPMALEGLSVLERAAATVVDIYAGDSQGSGTVLTPDGWILTNAHVVCDYAERPMEDIVVAVCSSLERPAVEMFRAQVVEFDAVRDLALLRVRSGFYGQPVPSTYRFPYSSVAEGRVQLGQRLWALGYPWIGGRGGRVSVTVTTGIVCGFENDGIGRMLKTDAGLSEGCSGGAAVNAEGQLVGIPSSFMEDGSSQISFVIPVSAIPAAWFDHFTR